jgi:peroxiredoxin
LELKGKGASIFVMDKSKLDVTVKGNEELPLFEIKGSKLNDDFEYVSSIQKAFRAKIDSLNQRFILAENLKDVNALTQIESEYNSANQALQSKIKQTITNSQKSIVSVFAASGLDPKTSGDFLDSLAEELSPLVDNSIIRDFVKDVEKIRNVRIGGVAPDFTGNTPDGRKISLADYKGKYLLVDFWASWCVPCRKENPNVVKLYEKYKDKNFEILSVSLDDDADKWKNAIQADGLKWQHVSDLKGWESEFAVLYSIEAIPQTYLLDREGKILAKNLRGEELEIKLKEILNIN